MVDALSADKVEAGADVEKQPNSFLDKLSGVKKRTYFFEAPPASLENDVEPQLPSESCENWLEKGFEPELFN